MSDSSDSRWENLCVGARICFTDWPVELERANLHVETIDLYDWLIESREELSVVEIDKDGFPVARVERMDLNAGGIAEGGPLAEVGDEFFEYALRVASRESTASERLGVGDHEFAPWTVGPTL